MLGVEDVSVLGVEDISSLRVDSALEDSLGVGKGEDPALGDGKALEASALRDGSALVFFQHWGMAQRWRPQRWGMAQRWRPQRWRPQCWGMAQRWRPQPRTRGWLSAAG